MIDIGRERREISSGNLSPITLGETGQPARIPPKRNTGENVFLCCCLPMEFENLAECEGLH